MSYALEIAQLYKTYDNGRTYALTNLLNWCLCRFMYSGMLL